MRLVRQIDINYIIIFFLNDINYVCAIEKRFNLTPKQHKHKKCTIFSTLLNSLISLQDGGTQPFPQRPQNRKTKWQLVRLSAAVCGIELCYAAETAFVSPILLKLGVPVSLMTMIWCLSPVLGFFLVPVMGSLSDR
jgi:hypothetical protein